MKIAQYRTTPIIGIERFYKSQTKNDGMDASWITEMKATAAKTKKLRRYGWR